MHEMGSLENEPPVVVGRPSNNVRGLVLGYDFGHGGTSLLITIHTYSSGHGGNHSIAIRSFGAGN
jgi:hypothetical protein